jgi:hypothetical protein
MANRKNWLGILVITLVFGMMVFGCEDDSTGGGGSTDPALNGTWVITSYDGDGSQTEYTLNNGNFEVSLEGIKMSKGTYTTSGNKITMTMTHSAQNAGDGMKFYTKTELKTLYKTHNGGTIDAQFESFLDQQFAPQTATYSISGNKLNVTSTYTDEDGLTKTSTQTLTKK